MNKSNVQLSSLEEFVNSIRQAFPDWQEQDSKVSPSTTVIVPKMTAIGDQFSIREDKEELGKMATIAGNTVRSLTTDTREATRFFAAIIVDSLSRGVSHEHRDLMIYNMSGLADFTMKPIRERRKNPDSSGDTTMRQKPQPGR